MIMNLLYLYYIKPLPTDLLHRNRWREVLSRPSTLGRTVTNRHNSLCMSSMAQNVSNGMHMDLITARLN